MEPLCTKVKFISKKFALEHIVRINKKSKRNTVPIRAYQCFFCNCWHLTSQEDLSSLLQEKDQKIIALAKELEEKELLIQEYVKKATKEDNLEIKKDERVKVLTVQITRNQESIKRLKKDNEDLIMKIVKLNKEIESLKGPLL